MPIDPILANPHSLKLPDPLEGYNNYLLAANRQEVMRDAQRKQAIRNALVEGYRQNTDANGVVNYNGLRNYAAKNMIGDAIPGLSEDELKNSKLGAERDLKVAETSHEGAKQKETEAKTTKTNQEAFKEAFGNYIKQLDAINPDPAVGLEQYAHWIMGKYHDPLMGKILREQGHTPDEEIAQLKAAAKSGPQGFQQFLMTTRMGMADATKNVITQEDLGSHKRILSSKTNSFGPAEQTVVSDKKVEEAPGDKYKGTHVQVAVPVQIATTTGNAMGNEMGKRRGEKLVSLEELNNNAPSEISAVDNGLRILRSGKVFTGSLAEQKTALLGIAKSLGISVDNQTLANSQMLRHLIASNMMGRLADYKAKGVSLTPMSNLDLEQFKATGPQMFDDPAVLIQMFGNYRQSVVNGVKQYKELSTNLSNGRYTGEAMGVYQPFPAASIPPEPGTGGGIPQAAIDYLRKNPGTAAKFEKTFNLPPGSAKKYLRK